MITIKCRHEIIGMIPFLFPKIHNTVRKFSVMHNRAVSKFFNLPIWRHLLLILMLLVLIIFVSQRQSERVDPDVPNKIPVITVQESQRAIISSQEKGQNQKPPPSKAPLRPHFPDELRPVIPFAAKFEEIKNSPDEGEDGITVSEMMTTLNQNDSRIINYIRKHHLTPPSTLPYNLSRPEVDQGESVDFTKYVKKLLPNETRGFFIEAGSNDGETLSGTLGFERFDGWTGLCVEPSPIDLVKWKSKHRKSWLADVCLSTTPMPVRLQFLHKEGYSIASQLGNPGEKGQEKGWRVFDVSCFPLFSILSALEIRKVDYFNLDVEGVEMDVLKTIPFSEVEFRVISVELHSRDARIRDWIKNFMTSQGFVTAWEYSVHPHFIFTHPSVSLDGLKN